MININAPCGFKPIDTLVSAEYTSKLKAYIIPEADSSVLYMYDAVRITGQYSSNGIPYITKAAAGEPMIGSVVGIKNVHTNEQLNYRVANKELLILVMADPFAEYVAQVNGQLSASAIGSYMDIAVAEGSTAIGLSGSQLDVTTLSDSIVRQFLVTGFIEQQGNTPGEFAKVKCMISKHQLKDFGVIDNYWSYDSGTNTLTPVYADANLHVAGKLTVDGLIDPTGVVVTPQESPPSTENGTYFYDSNNDKFSFREAGVWVTIPTGGGGEMDYDATVGTGGDYATQQLAVNAGKFKLLLLDGYVETQNVTLPSAGAYYIYAKKTVDLAGYSYVLYPSASTTNAIYFSGQFSSVGRLLACDPVLATRTTVHILPGTTLNQSTAVKDASGILTTSNVSVNVFAVFYPGSTYLLPENDVNAIIMAGGGTTFNQCTIAFPGSTKNFAEWSNNSSHFVTIIGGLNSTGNIGSITAGKTLFTLTKLDGFLDFGSTIVTNGNLFSVKVFGTYKQLGQIIGPITAIPRDANAFAFLNNSLQMDDVPAIANKSQIGDDHPKSIWLTLDESDCQISNLAGYVLNITGSGNTISSFRVLGAMSQGAIVDRTSPKTNQANYGLGGVAITNPGSGVVSSSIFPSGGSGSGAGFSVVASGGVAVNFNSYVPSFSGAFRYGTFICGSGYQVGDILTGAYGIQLQVLDVYDGNTITISGNNNVIEYVSGPCGNVKITGNNNLVYVPADWVGTKSDTGTGNRVIIGVKDPVVYSTTTATAANVVIESDGTLKRSTASAPAFLATMATTQTNVTGDGPWVKYIFDTQVQDVGGVYDPTTALFTAPYKCMLTVGANAGMTNAVIFPAASDYQFKFVRRNSSAVVVEEVECVKKSCQNQTSGASDNYLADNVFTTFACNAGDTVELQGRVSTVGVRTVSFVAATSQRFFGNITAILP